MWQGKYQVEVTAGKQLGFTVIEPLFLCQRLAFRAMSIPAGVICDLLKPALVTLLDMAAEFSRAAYFNMVHGFELFIGNCV